MQKYKTINDFFEDLKDDRQLRVKALRSLILETEPRLKEHIKWNAPSYILNDEDRITFNLMNKQGTVKLVFHMGATRKEDKNADPVMIDNSGLIEWSSNIRGIVTFTDMNDVVTNQDLLKKIIKDWLSIPTSI